MNPKKTREENTILEQLERGNWIRLQDGRCGDGFVDTKALSHLIETNQVEVFDNKGVPFVRALKKEPTFKHLNIKDLLLEGETDPDLAVIQGEGALIVTMPDFVHWIEEGEELTVEVWRMEPFGSRLVTLKAADIIANRLGADVDIPKWGHYFGIKTRVHTNYHLLFGSMRFVGLSTDKMPEWK